MESMENFGERIRKSGRGLSDHGLRVLARTEGASKELATFVQTEAKGWGDYLREQYKHLEGEGRGLLRKDIVKKPHAAIRARVDDLLKKVKGRSASESAGVKTAQDSESSPSTSESSPDSSSEPSSMAS